MSLDRSALDAATEQEIIILTEQILHSGIEQIIEGQDMLTALDNRNQIEAFSRYANKRIRSSLLDRNGKLEATNNLVELRIRLERVIGTMLIALPKQHGARMPDAGYSDSSPSLDDLQITHNQSAQWQTVARLDEYVFDGLLLDAKEKLWELSSFWMYQQARGLQIEPDGQGAAAQNNDGQHIVLSAHPTFVQDVINANIVDSKVTSVTLLLVFKEPVDLTALSGKWCLFTIVSDVTT